MDHEVVIAGGGPVGLLLACELRRSGAPVVVLEGGTTPDQLVLGGVMGARSLNACSVLTLHQRGLLDEVRRRSLFWFDPTHEDAPRPPFLGHFAGIPLRADLLDIDDPDLAHHTLGGGAIALLDLVDILTEEALRLGVEIHRGVQVTDLEADTDGVSITTTSTAATSSIPTKLTTNWLVGCDGGRSMVRKLAGFAFPGVDAEFTGRQALVDIADPDQLVAGDWQRGAGGAYVIGAWGDTGSSFRIHTVEYEPVTGHHPVTLDELQTSLRSVSGTDVIISKVHAATRYTDVTRQADTYRRGRVLLAGDAAHVHSPAGGQGLNLGIGDAVSLGPKLAAVASGTAPSTLLDTYTAERHPAGAWVQRWSMAQTAIGRGDARTDALHDVVADLINTPGGTTYVMKKIAGLPCRTEPSAPLAAEIR